MNASVHIKATDGTLRGNPLDVRLPLKASTRKCQMHLGAWPVVSLSVTGKGLEGAVKHLVAAQFRQMGWDIQSHSPQLQLVLTFYLSRPVLLST